MLSYNEIDPRRRHARVVCDPPGIPTPELERRFQELLGQHPLILHYRRTGDGRALKISDFLSRRAFKRLELYSEFFRPLGVESQIAVTLPSPRRKRWPPGGSRGAKQRC